MNEINQNELTVNNNRNLAHYVIGLGDTMIGLAAYQQAPNLIVFTHTEVNDEFEGAGVGSRLIRQALEDPCGRIPSPAVVPVRSDGHVAAR